jgi:hypothetical protein
MSNSKWSVSLWAAGFAFASLVFNFQTGECQTSGRQAQSNFDHLPLLFEKNVGQTDPQVRYLARCGRYQLYLTDQSTVLKVAGDKSGAVIRTTFLDAMPSVAVAGVKPQAAKTNYLRGSSTSWNIGVANFGAVKYEGVYPGIDVTYYSRERKLEYDFVVAPRASADRIGLRVEGADKIATSADGSLVLSTAAGEVRWQAPVAYQKSGERRVPVKARYRVAGNRVGFEIGAYDRRKELTIDPALVYGTYLDGSNNEFPTGFYVDAAGFAYIVGSTTSTDFPVTPGTYQSFHGGTEAFISKLSQDGSQLIWSTMIAGTASTTSTAAWALAVDPAGDVYVVGQTGDFDSNGQPTVSTFPSTPGAYNSVELAGYREYLVKLNGNGSALDFSTFLSTTPNVYPNAVTFDAVGNVYVAGYYNHASGLTAPFPATAGAFQSTYGGDNDAFVMKFNSTGSSLEYATLVGGVHDDTARHILVDAAGNATIAGPTYSSDYPISTNGRRQAADAGGFVTTLNSTGTALMFSTVLNNVLAINLQRDEAGYYYVGGSASTGLPTTANAFQKTFPSSETDTHQGFLTEMDPSGNLVYSSYIGGNVYSSSFEETQVLLYTPGSVVVGGYRLDDATFPVTDRTYEQDNCSYLAKFDTGASGAQSLVYSGCTPLNETNNTTVNLFRGDGFYFESQLQIDGNDNLYALNYNGPTSANAFQKSPPNPNSNNGSFTWFGKYALAQPDTGGVNLSNPPLVWNFPQVNPVAFRATGRSPQCSAGVAAMRIYTAPGVSAYTTLEATVNAYISFPGVIPNQPMSFNPVIVVYDNCGKAFSLTVPVLVMGASTTPPNPLVVSPTDATPLPGGGPNGAVVSPVHFVASASAPSCNQGVAAMRIYTAPGVGAYTVSGGSIDTYLKMASGTYNVVVQAWDNCGNVYKTPLMVAVE